MAMNTFGHLFRVTTWGESHGPALGADVWYGPQRDYVHTLALDFSATPENGSLN